MPRGAKPVLAAAVALGASAVAAQEQKVYTYADKWFSIEFPADPTTSQGTYDVVTASGGKVTAPATIYSLRQKGAEYRVTVADVTGTAAADPHALDYAIAAYRRERKDLALDNAVSHSLAGGTWQLCGRQFGFADGKGRLNYETIYYNANTRLFYDIYAHVEPAAQAEHGAEVSHFQASLALLADPDSKAPAPPSYPDNWAVRDHPEYGFSIRFPAEPQAAKGAYRSFEGVEVPADRYWVQSGDTLYRLTVAHLYETQADDGDVVDKAANVWRGQGTVLADNWVAISGGQCGREVTVRAADGTTSRVTIYFPSSQHRLYVIEAARKGAVPPADPEDDRRFRASLTLAKAE